MVYPGRHLQLGHLSSADFLFTLIGDLRAAAQRDPPDQERMKKIYAFVRWCLKRQNRALRRVAIERFVVHMGALERVREDMPTLLGPALFKRKRIFRDTLDPADYEATVAVYIAAELRGVR